MNKKLTLKLHQEVIRQGKKYAKKNNTSLSKLVENYLKLLVQEEESIINEPLTEYEALKKTGGENTSLVKRVRGAINTSNVSGDERFNYLIEKYG